MRLLLLTAVVWACAGPAAAAPGYTLRDISGGGVFEFASAINNAGVVTGYSTEGGAYIASPGGGLLHLDGPWGPAPPLGSVRGIDINDRGEVAGSWTGGGQLKGFRYTPAGGVSDLGDTEMSISHIDAQGRISGLGWGPNGVLPGYLVAEPGAAAALREAPVSFFNVAGLRADGSLVASRIGSGGYPVAGQLVDGAWRDLPQGGASDSQAVAFNEQGAVVGALTTVVSEAGVEGAHAFAYTPDGGLVDLAAAVGGFIPYSVSTAVNEHGLVVGYGARGSGWETFSFIHDLSTGSFLDHTEAIAPDSAAGWSNFFFTDVNDRGQIAGWGQFEGQIRAFVLSPTPPVPEPSAAWLLVLGLGAVGAAVRRRAA